MLIKRGTRKIQRETAEWSAWGRSDIRRTGGGGGGWNEGSVQVINTYFQTGANYGQSNPRCKRERGREAEEISPSQAA